ncbi:MULTISPECIES: MDR family MFS transporter [unclassified Pseudomonas]|jgi:MFS transporter, DHA2 family, multidrug resistance protein|uniref:MDR family MFS transporter n=1 Tax=unclassified Pseudomonas TaxID=196821 RepID=UPI0015A0667A|nr:MULTISPECIES: MDR family MFS transporter [unclassified Pseudomonas]MDP9032386.1 multidrug efflux MFS transporter [Pseudomonadota bacterium]MDE1911065.1 multidrug efflux MFS transporter [Pseudomonas sp.]MDE2037010.1 multidrug efflux MFS transporter [Pseudomonas sp.]MDE2191029.1 multidrug efflux MFS transporter [Pseudomonas sp.]MDE2557862.1 multidrug efflux MFS transporter [Pseudomonas sp.]
MAGDQLLPPVGEPSRRDWIAVMSVMLGAFMAVLDIQITNSSLKDIQGALSATLEEGSWISTSYLVAEIIMIPLTAWLVQLLSARRLAVWVSGGFLIASLMCSMAWSLESMIVFRALQGFTGGALIPLAFTLTLIKLPEHHRAKGMAMFAMTATFAPSIGPTIGGWLTENWGWEYIFYINIPPGLIMIAGLLYGLEKKDSNWDLLKSTDYLGILTMAVGLGCLQVFLEEGHRKDWLESNLIVSLGTVALLSLITFVIVQMSKPNPLINLRILGNRNFGLSSISSLGMGVGLYGSIYLLPLYLAQIQNYNALQIGEVIMWMGVPQLFLIPLVPKLMKYVSPKWLCTLGFGLFGLASFSSGVLNPDFAGDQFNRIQIIRALGQPLIMVTISLIATAYIMQKDAGSASSLFNILRNLGGAIGIALLATLLDARTKTYFDYLREAIVPTNPQVAERMARLTETFGSETAALGKLSEIAHQQAQIMAYNDAFHFVGLALGISMVAILLTKALPAGLKAGEAH